MKLQWWHFVAGGGLIAGARHLGFALGYLGQIVWEGFVEGAAARRTANNDPTPLPGTQK